MKSARGSVERFSRCTGEPLSRAGKDSRSQGDQAGAGESSWRLNAEGGGGGRAPRAFECSLDVAGARSV